MSSETTKNQHFVSQAEQRLNAIDPDAKRRKRKIYRIRVNRNESGELELGDPEQEYIKEALSCPDLFTFDLLDRERRRNLEMEFQRYEDKVYDHTRSLEEKLLLRRSGVDVTNEVLELFLIKFLNSLRNPFCIERTRIFLDPIIRHLSEMGAALLRQRNPT